MLWKTETYREISERIGMTGKFKFNKMGSGVVTPQIVRIRREVY